MSYFEEPKGNSMIANTSDCDLASSVVVETDKRREIEGLEKLTNQVAKGAGIAFIGDSIRKVAGFGLHILLGRMLGPGTYGLYALGRSITSITQSIASLGLTKGIVRYCAMYRGEDDKARVKGTIFSALGILLITSLLIAFFLFVFAGIISERFFNELGLTNVLRVFALALPFYVLIGMTAAFAQSFKRIECQQGINVFRSLVDLGLVYLAFLLGFRLAGAMYGFLASGVLSAGLGFYLLWKIFPEIKSKIRPIFDQINKLIQFSLPMMFANMSYLLAMRADRIMLGLFRDARDVGIYNAAANVALQFTFIRSGLVSIFMPIISDVYNKGHFSYMKKLYNVVKRWSSYGLFSLILPVIFFPKLVISIYGGEFVEGWLTLMVLLATRIVGSITGPTGALLQMTGRQNVELLNSLLMITINIVLNYFLIPIYGYFGVALATFLSVFSMNMIQLGQIYHFFGFHPFDSRHTGFIGLTSAIFASVITANMFLVSRFKLFLFLVVGGLFFTFVYKSRTEQDKVIWKVVKLKLVRRGMQ